MQKKYLVALVLSCLLIGQAGVAFATERLRLATTTSTENSGLLAELLPPFEMANDCKVDVIAVGTGKAIKLGETGSFPELVSEKSSRFGTQLGMIPEKRHGKGMILLIEPLIVFTDFMRKIVLLSEDHLVGLPADCLRVRLFGIHNGRDKYICIN